MSYVKLIKAIILDINFAIDILVFKALAHITAQQNVTFGIVLNRQLSFFFFNLGSF